MNLRGLKWLFIMLLAVRAMAADPVHFTGVTTTSNSMTIAIKTSINPSIGGVPLAVGDEIGAFKPAGLLTGAVVWEGTNTAITIYGAEGSPTNLPGMANGEDITFKVWRAAINKEFNASETYSSGDGIYNTGDIEVMASFTADAYTLTMAVNPAGAGTTTPAAGSLLCTPNEVVTISAAPTGSYIFVNWTGTAIADPNAASTTVTVGANKTVTANFRIPYGSIGDKVWNDTDKDGLQDGGEPGLDGVTVKLYASGGTTPLNTTTTSAGGAYSFTNVVPGNYFIEFTALSNYSFSPKDQGVDDAVDSDAGTSDGETAVFALAADASKTSVDAGMYPQPAAIGNLVWSDTDRDGVQDAGEPGLSGVSVELFTSANVSKGTTTTDANGGYYFTNLAPGDYYVQFTLKTDYNFSPLDQGGNDATDSDANTTTGKTATTTLVAAETDNGWDAGMYPKPAAIGNFVWLDANKNGLQDTGETGMSGVEVRLYNSANTQVGTTTTDANGAYSFTNLAPGDYYLRFIHPLNYYFSMANQGADDAKDSDADTGTGQTTTTTLLPNETDNTWDVGMYPAPAEIGNLVWVDTDRDGIQDSGEPGLDGVTVEIYTSADVWSGSTTTSGGGLYVLAVDPGDYYLKFTLPTDYQFSPADQGADDSKDSDANTTTGKTSVTTLAVAEVDNNWDVGMYLKPAAIGNFVWSDTDKDGVQDAGEPGLSGVTVQLYTSGNVLSGTTTTDANGAYSFTNITPGDYYVKFTKLTNYNFSPADQGGDDTKDSDANVSTGQTTTTTLAANETDNTWDAGMYPAPATIGNLVWVDTDRDGVQDAGETGLDGVTVELYTSADVLVSTTTTSGGGAYTFGPDPGTYYVQFTLPTDYQFSPIDQGGDDTKDSDANITTGKTITTTLTAGESDLTWDAGMYLKPAAIGNLVWSDTDKDGVQDAGEPGLTNVTVQLYTSGNVLSGTTTTDANGAYSFTNITPGSYYVKFTKLTNYNFSPIDQGGDDTKDSDANVSTGQTTATTLAANETDNNWDAGMYPSPAAIGNFVWSDTDKDGVQDAGEPGLSGVSVELFTSANVSKGTTTTDASGNYSFTNLDPGDYYVQFTLKTDYNFSPLDQGGNDATDSDANTTTGKTATTTLVAAETDNNWDAGMYPKPAAIGNFVWSDTDKDGVQDAGELGLANVTVQLYTSGNVLSGTTTTDANGAYSFTNITPGSYYVKFTKLTNYNFSPVDQGGNDATDSDANTTTGQTTPTTLSPNETDNTWDAGMYPAPAAIGNLVWSDTDKDGVQDAGEPGLSGVSVELFTSANVSKGTTTTDASGNYSFTNLDPGDYYVQFTLKTDYNFSPLDQGGNDATDSDANTTTGKTATTTLVAAETDNNWDAGMYLKPAAIGNFVWSDTDKDGVQDAGEPGLSGVTVQLYTSANVLSGTATTDASGAYSFTSLTPGDYYVKFTKLANYNFSPIDQGGDDTKDSDANVSTGQTTATTLAANETDNNWDAGMYPAPATIGNFVWVDTDRDGVQDSGETGLDGVTVELYTSADVLVSTTTTSGGGAYTFGPDPGTYYVKFTLPTDYQFSPIDQGGDDTKDSDANITTGKTITTTLTAGESDLTWDAGMYLKPAAIGNFVWSDTDKDGVQDAGELGLANVTVQLYTSGNVLSGTTTTDANGAYSFTNITPGSYYVKFTKLTNYNFSPIDQGGDDTKDSDASTTTGQTIATTLSPNETDNTWDAGMYPAPAAIGNLVWVDKDRDGIQDSGETGLDGVTVQLYTSADVLVSTTTTSGGGSYSFGPDPGNYYVKFTLPATYQFSPADQGGDDTKDSDANITTGKTAITTLTAGENDQTWDAGINVIPATVGDLVWTDTDKDGVQDAGETGLSGVTVRLYASGASTATATTTTATAGAYSFATVEPGSYFIEFVLPTSQTATYYFSPADQGGDDAKDSDANTSTGRTAVFTLASAAANSTIDAGIYTLAKVTYTLATSPAGLKVSVDGIVHKAPYSWATNEAATHTIATTTPQDTAGARYAFSSWSDAGAMSHSITVGAANATITANFTASHYFLTTAVKPAEGGAITPAPPGAWMTANSPAIVTAAPNAQWLFNGFTGDANNTTVATDTVAMNDPKSVTANFVPLIPPKVIFWATPTIGNPTLSVKFYDASEGDPTGWLWDFGDGQTSTEQNPLHVYWQPGKYAVKLTITTLSGNVSLEKEDFIVVHGYEFSPCAMLDLIDNSMSSSGEGWNNAIDQDISGLDGTVTAGGPMAYAIFKFHDNKTKKVNMIRMLADTDVNMEERWTRAFDVYVSMTGLEDADFSLLLRGVKKDGAWQEFACTPTDAKFIKLVLTSPATGWRQLGEFAVCVEKEYPDFTRSTITAITPRIANGVDASKMTITLKKSSGAALEGLTVDDFYLYSYSGAFKYTPVQANSTPGVYTTSITTIEPGFKEIKVMVQSRVIGNVTINFSAPVISEAPLTFIEGTTTSSNEGWDNLIDGDEEGWEGTTTAGGNDPYAIFSFKDNSIKAIQQVALLMDTGVGYEKRWVQRFRLQASTTGKSSADFVTVFDGVAMGGDWQTFIFPAFKAKYFKLMIDFPKEGWKQLGEMRVFTTTLPAMSQQANDLTMIGDAPEKWTVSNNYPNPFNPETSIEFSIPNSGHVKATVFNMLGQKVRTLVDQEVAAGTHRLVWDSRSETGEIMPSGIYYLRFEMGAQFFTRKVVLTR